MDVLAWLNEAGVGETRLAWLLVALAFAPLLIWRWTIAIARVWRADFGPCGLTLVASIMVGLGALAALLPRASLTWDAIVGAGGFWDLTPAAFLAMSVGLAQRAVAVLVEIPRSDFESRRLQSWMAAAAALWSIRLMVGLIGGPSGSRKIWFPVAEAVAFVAGIFATIHAGALLLWSVNRLNFWLFLVLILLIQDYRYHDPPIVARVVSWLSRPRPRRRGSDCAS